MNTFKPALAPRALRGPLALAGQAITALEHLQPMALLAARLHVAQFFFAAEQMIAVHLPAPAGQAHPNAGHHHGPGLGDFLLEVVGQRYLVPVTETAVQVTAEERL